MLTLQRSRFESQPLSRGWDYYYYLLLFVLFNEYNCKVDFLEDLTYQMSNCVKHREEESRTSTDLVELQVRVQGDVLVQRVLLHLRD